MHLSRADSSAACAQEGVRHIVLTLGPLGAALCRSGPGPGLVSVQHLPAAPAQVISTSGAGDCLVAGCAAALLAGAQPLRMLATGLVSASNEQAGLAFCPEMMRACVGYISHINCWPPPVYMHLHCERLAMLQGLCAACLLRVFCTASDQLVQSWHMLRPSGLLCRLWRVRLFSAEKMCPSLLNGQPLSRERKSC